ncbi:unnamed protein product [Trifolium pratense]|uniref:Uncharacterized protein n=1 Tax=Trifolium pratense TaxID=57577 RepID=A0ACB0KHX0_TRIPR|nr:unnamed protein product [Trifolium pratense]
MDGPTTNKSNVLSANSQKLLSKRTNFSFGNLKRARRILAQRKFFARIRERKLNKYISNLEKSVLALYTEATSMSAELSKIKIDTLKLMAENNEMRSIVQTIEEEIDSKEEIIDALNEKRRHLEEETMIGLVQQYYHNNAFLVAQQFQQENDNGDEEEEEDEVMQEEEKEEEEDK